MEKSDAIVIGGGMAGLSSAAFLSLAGRSVTLLEKQDKVGGFASSFERQGVSFDIGIEGVRELAPDSFLPPFLRWWGVDLPMEERHETMAVATKRGRYRIRGDCARDDLMAAFPASARRIDRFFGLNEKILAELTGGPAPKPPSEMGLLQKLAFGVNSLARRPNLIRHGLRNCSSVVPALFDDPELVRVAASKTFEDMVYLAVAHRWEGFASGKTMYPKGGMGALPEAIAASLRSRGGRIELSAEVQAVRQTATGFQADCADGRSFAAAKLIVSAPMPWAAFGLFRDDARFDRLRSAIRRRKAFPSCFMSFIALDPGFDLGGANYIVDWADDGPLPVTWPARTEAGRPDASTAPLACIVSGTGSAPGKPIAMTVAATLGWDHAGTWGLADSRSTDAMWLGAPPDYGRSASYREIKEATEAVVLDRLAARFGSGFRGAVLHSWSSTPLTFARYTNSPGGSYMGFSIRSGEYGRFFTQGSPVPGLTFAGQWVFPGFGVAGAAASGYYATKALLSGDGDDLDARLRSLEA